MEEVVEHHSSRTGRWLRAYRLRIALWIAALEGVITWLEADVTKWTVIAIACVALLFYVFVGRNYRSETARQLSWILGASQSLAVLAAIFAFVLKWLALLVAALLAVLALFYLFGDRARERA